MIRKKAMTSLHKLTVVILTGIVTLGLAVAAEYSLLLQTPAIIDGANDATLLYSYHY